MRKRGRSDENQDDLVKALRAVRCRVLVLSGIGQGAPDLLVLSPFTNALHLLEVKDGAKVPSARKLTSDEQDFSNEWGVVQVVNDEAEALAAVKRRPRFKR